MSKIFSKNLTKNLVFSLFCVLITSILIMWLIFPQIKIYKTLMLKKQNQERINAEHQSQHDALVAKLNELVSANNKMIKMYEHSFDTKEFERFCARYFNSVSLEYLKQKSNEKYLSYTLKVSTNIDSPVYFYDFVKALENYSSLVKVEFPISFIARSSEIEAVFDIKVFGSDSAKPSDNAKQNEASSSSDNSKSNDTSAQDTTSQDAASDITTDDAASKTNANDTNTVNKNNNINNTNNARATMQYKPSYFSKPN